MHELVPVIKTAEPLYVKDSAGQVTGGSVIKEKIEELRRRYGAVGVANKLAEAAVRRVGKSVDERTVASVKRSVGVDVSGFMTRNGAMKEVMSAATKANVGLIKSIHDKYFDDLSVKLMKGVEAGERASGLISAIKEVADISDRRAELIARDQVSKMNGAMTMLRQMSLGINRYTWQTSGDERVREEHTELDGKEFAWDDPPEEGHPGEPVNCRCVAAPVINLDTGEENESGLTLGGVISLGLAAAAIGAYFGEWASEY